MKLTNRVFKTVVTLVGILTILLNISCTAQSHRLKERKAALPIYLRVLSFRNFKKEELIKSLHRMLRMLQKSLDRIQVQVDRVNNENKSGFFYEMPIMELPVILLISHKFKGGDFMAHDKVLIAVGKATQNILAEDCSNGNGSGLLGYMRNGMDFEVRDYDFWGKIAENVLKNLNYVGGDVSAHKNQKN